MNTNMIDRKAAAEMVGVAVGTLANWQSTGRYRLPHLKIGKHVRYRTCDLERWLALQVVNPLPDDKVAL